MPAASPWKTPSSSSAKPAPSFSAPLKAQLAKRSGDYGVIKEKIRNDLKRFIQKSTSRRPLIMPVIMEI